MDKLLERFLNYVSLDTQSKAGVRQVPSTEGQWKLLHLLKEQLEEMGLIKVTLSEKGTLMATLPANVPGDTQRNIATAIVFNNLRIHIFAAAIR